MCYSTVSAYGTSVQYDARGAIWPNDWHSSGSASIEQSSAVSSQCRQSAMNEGQRSLATSGREQFSDMVGTLGSASSTHGAAEYGDLASMFTSFME